MITVSVFAMCFVHGIVPRSLGWVPLFDVLLPANVQASHYIYRSLSGIADVIGTEPVPEVQSNTESCIIVRPGYAARSRSYHNCRATNHEPLAKRYSGLTEGKLRLAGVTSECISFARACRCLYIGYFYPRLHMDVFVARIVGQYRSSPDSALLLRDPSLFRVFVKVIASAVWLIMACSSSVREPPPRAILCLQARLRRTSCSHPFPASSSRSSVQTHYTHPSVSSHPLPPAAPSRTLDHRRAVDPCRRSGGMWGEGSCDRPSLLARSSHSRVESCSLPSSCLAQVFVLGHHVSGRDHSCLSSMRCTLERTSRAARLDSLSGGPQARRPSTVGSASHHVQCGSISRCTRHRRKYRPR